jgi:hypothetical protein
MDNVQKHNICTNVPFPQTFRSCLYMECLTLLTDLITTVLDLQILLKFHNIKLSENLSIGSRIVTFGHTGRYSEHIRFILENFRCSPAKIHDTHTDAESLLKFRVKIME